MKMPEITIRRYPYEEPYHLNLRIWAASEHFSGHLEYYCNATDLVTLGEALKSFPRQIPDEYIYELGSAKPEDRFAFHFQLKAYTTNSRGACAIQISINNNAKVPDRGSAQFSLVAEPAAINRLGDLLMKFGELKHLELTWQASGEGSIHAQYQERCRT